jgi:hypothetical protein
MSFRASNKQSMREALRLVTEHETMGFGIHS